MNRREQLAKDNGMTIEFVNWFFDNKIDGCGNAWLVMMAAMWESWKYLSEQRDALAAECAALKSCAEFYNVGFSPVKGTFGLEWKPTQKLLDDCGNIASDALKTPATDAFLREVRAQGVEMFAAAQRELANKYPGSTSYAYRSDIAVVAAVFADQLRKGGAA